MSRFLLRTKSRSQRMGRIAYLSKRGNIWWFRRRHPAIVIPSPQNPQGSGLCVRLTGKAQAKGHLAISLQTSSSREARLLGTRLSDHFERAWVFFEAGAYRMTDQDDPLDMMALMLTEGFRKFITHYRASGMSGMAPGVRERAFARLDTELREALGIEPLPYADMLTRVEIKPGIKYIVLNDPDPNAPMTPEDEFHERMAAQAEAEEAATRGFAAGEYSVAQAMNPSDIRLIDPEDEHSVNRLETMADGFGRLLDQYLVSCEKSGLDPQAEMPSAQQIAKNLHRAAVRLGLPEPTAPNREDIPSKAKPAYSNEPFTEFAEKYLALRCQGYTMRREDETPHAATGINFERTSLRNWQSSVRVFSEIVGDLPLSEMSKDEVIEFNKMIQRLPANFGKSSRDNRSARQVIEDTDESEPMEIAALLEKLRNEGKPSNEMNDAIAAARTKRISATTIKRHQTALQSIFEHALSQGMIASNPFKGRLLTEAEVKRWKKSEARIERIGWGDSIYTLLGSEVFSNPLSDIGEPLFWTPLIAMYAGLRLEEICQLRVQDFAKDNGIIFVAVQNQLGSQLVKTANSIRRIPLHKALIDIGLPKLVELRQQAGMSRLFPDMPRSKSKGTMSAIMSKRFGYYIRSRGIKEDGLDFHALRTEFLVRLTRNKVPDHVRKGLMGHEQTDVTHANYFRAGETVEDMKEYVDRIDIDHKGIAPPFGAYLPPERLPLRLVR
jgi:integrase